jgi:hypothetical protein
MLATLTSQRSKTQPRRGAPRPNAEAPGKRALPAPVSRPTRANPSPERAEVQHTGAGRLGMTNPLHLSGRYPVARVKAAAVVAGAGLVCSQQAKACSPRASSSYSRSTSWPDPSTLDPLSPFSPLPFLHLADFPFHLSPDLVGQNTGPATSEGATYPITAPFWPAAPTAISVHLPSHGTGHRVVAEGFQGPPGLRRQEAGGGSSGGGAVAHVLCAGRRRQSTNPAASSCP